MSTTSSNIMDKQANFEVKVDNTMATGKPNMMDIQFDHETEVDNAEKPNMNLDGNLDFVFEPYGNGMEVDFVGQHGEDWDDDSQSDEGLCEDDCRICHPGGEVDVESQAEKEENEYQDGSEIDVASKDDRVSDMDSEWSFDDVPGTEPISQDDSPQWDTILQEQSEQLVDAANWVSEEDDSSQDSNPWDTVENRSEIDSDIESVFEAVSHDELIESLLLENIDQNQTKDNEKTQLFATALHKFKAEKQKLGNDIDDLYFEIESQQQREGALCDQINCLCRKNETQLGQIKMLESALKQRVQMCKDLEEHIDTQEVVIDEMTESIKDSESETLRLQEKIDELEEHALEQDAQVEELNEMIKIKSDLVSGSREWVEKLEIRIWQLGKQKSKLETKLTEDAHAFGVMIVNLENDKQEMMMQICQLGEQNSSLHKQLKDAMDASTRLINEWNEEKETLRKEKDIATASDADHIDQLDLSNSELERISSELGAANHRIEHLLTRNFELEGANYGLRQNQEYLSGTVYELKENQQSLLTTIEEYQEANRQFHRDNDEHISSMMAAHQVTYCEKTGLVQANGALELENANLRNDLSYHAEQLALLSQANAAVELDSAKLKNDLKSAEHEHNITLEELKKLAEDLREATSEKETLQKNYQLEKDSLAGSQSEQLEKLQAELKEKDCEKQEWIKREETLNNAIKFHSDDIKLLSRRIASLEKELADEKNCGIFAIGMCILAFVLMNLGGFAQLL